MTIKQWSKKRKEIKEAKKYLKKNGVPVTKQFIYYYIELNRLN